MAQPEPDTAVGIARAELAVPNPVPAGGGIAWVAGIVRWQDVQVGDLVLMNDGLVVAEEVLVNQKPWGPDTTFTAVDIGYTLDNGAFVSSEHHGDRLTAVRRPVT
jgi:hypothetical protein